MREVFIIGLKEILKFNHLWIVNAAGLIAIIFLPEFQVFYFSQKNIAILDILHACLFSCVLFLLFSSAHSLFSKELKSKIALNIFTKPIHPFALITAKYGSLFCGILICILIQGSFSILYNSIIYDWGQKELIYSLLSMWSILLQGAILLSMTSVFSIFMGSLVSIFLTISLMIVGKMIPPQILDLISPLVPVLNYYDLSAMFYKESLPSIGYLLYGTLFAVLYIIWMLFIGAYFLKKKEF